MFPHSHREGDVTHKLFLRAEEDLIRNDYGIAKAAGLDVDEGTHPGGDCEDREDGIE